MKALLKVGYTCNNNCVFCHSSEHRGHADLTTSELLRKVDLCAAAGRTMVVLSGGEPTARKDLLEVAAHVVGRGLDLGLVSNGRMLSYGKLLDRLVELRLRYLYVSLHGDRVAHDAMVRARAWEQSLAGARAAAARGLVPTVNCVVTRLNLGRLRCVVDALLGAGALTVKYSMVEAKGSALDDFDRVVPTVTEAAAAIADAIGHARARGLEAAHDGTPFCLLPGLEHLYDDLATNGFADMSEAFEEGLFPVDELNRTKPGDVCAGCALAARCPGLYVAYHERQGAGELKRVVPGARTGA
ncbi:MAG: radical SAM protein [Deltaproteobacteria bacterium]|nr:radical SAM protein [Deltaproteobacteria bacterium]